jgi:hypothetical protein
METDPASETLYSLEYWTLEKVQKPSNPICYTPSSESFTIYLNQEDEMDGTYIMYRKKDKCIYNFGHKTSSMESLKI